MKSSSIAIILTLLIGFVIGLVVKGDLDQPGSSVESTDQITSVVSKVENSSAHLPSDQLTNDVIILQQMLEGEINARESLQKQLDALSKQVATLDQTLQAENSVNGDQPTENSDSSDPQRESEDWFNTQALIDSGMSSREANDLKTFFEQQELDRMYLRDQSIREDWDRQKFREEMQILRDKSDALLDNLNDDAYDAFLYASGQPNRVEVTSVLESAQAGSVGIRAGDRIISYDNKRIYSGFELRTATAGGNINDSIIVEVERDGEILEFYLARGPLGIRMNSVSEAPTR